MRDLYQRLDIASTASAAEVRLALDACQHTALKAEASVVLDVQSRRDEYDRLHALLCDIGRLRSRLGLTHGLYWQGSVANDFSIPPDTARSRHDALVEKLGEAVALHGFYQRVRRCLPWLVGGGLTGLGALVVAIALGVW